MNNLLKSADDTFTKCREVLTQKSADYTGGKGAFYNFNLSEVVGVEPKRGMLVRIMDKIARASHILETEPEAKDEKLEDTILDAINYLAILKAKVEEENT